MKLLLIALTAVLTLTHSVIADVTTKPVTPRLTNRPVHVPPLQTNTNLTNAERLGSAIERIKKDADRLSELFDSLDDMARFLQSTEKEMAMLEGATNLIKLTYYSKEGNLTVMIVNPVESGKDTRVIQGRFHFHYPKAWRVSDSYYEREKASLSKQHCGINFRFGTNSLNWNLDLKSPFLNMAPADREKAKEEFQKLTTVPLDKLRFDPADVTQVWIADYGKEETAEKKK